MQKHGNAHIEVRPSCDWAVSHIDKGKRIFSRYDGCGISLYECLFTRMRFILPIIAFKEGLLSHLAISLSQLQLFAWTFAKML